MNKEKISILVSIAICILISLIGATIQYSSESSVALARSGSLIVCVGIIRIFFDLKIGFSDIEKRYANNPNAGGLEDAVDSLGSNVERAKNRHENSRASIDNPAAKTDLAILVMGTILWGFGDLWI